MPGHILAETFLARHDHQFTALLTLAITAALVVVVNRALAGRGRRLAAAVRGGDLSQGADTRLRFLRRVADATIITIGVALALSQFTALDRLGRTVLASSAIAAAVIGFAARQVLANAIAGLQLAVAQPLRIGDTVTFEDQTGVVEDIRLTSTWLRTGADARIVVPNERLAAGILRNDTIVSPRVALEASVWLAADNDPLAAVDALRTALPGVTVRVGESAPEGVRLQLTGEPRPAAERAAGEAELREAALRAIREADLGAGRRNPV